MFKRKSVGKRILSVVLAAVIAVPMFSGGACKDMSKVQAATMPGNPRKGTDGVIIWDCVWFGRYPQSSARGEKKDAIKWRVLSVNGNDAFLVADCNLDTRCFNEKNVAASWENSTIRSWLNGYDSTKNVCGINYASSSNFINTAFGATEQKAIMDTVLDNPGNEYYPKKVTAAAGNNTTDKVFLLSYKEATNPAYGFMPVNPGEPTYEDRTSPSELSISIGDVGKVRKNTEYVGAGGTEHSKGQNAAGQSGCWWLRSNGEEAKWAAYVTSTGSILVTGNSVNWAPFAVCPAIHLDLSNAAVWSFAGTVNANGKTTPGEAPPVIDEVVKKDDNNTFVVDKDSQTAEYKASDSSSAEEISVPSTVTVDGSIYKVTSIANGAFKNNKKLKKITIEGNIETIGKDAFKGCTNLKTVVIGKGVTVIGESAFSGCSKLENVTMGTRVEKIKAKAFYKCTKLKKISIPSTVASIGKQAFYGCKNLKKITISTYRLKKSNVGAKAFKGINAKATIKVPAAQFKAYKTLLKSKGVGSKAKIKK